MRQKRDVTARDVAGNQPRGESAVARRAGIKNRVMLVIYACPRDIFAAHQEPQVVLVLFPDALDPRIRRSTGMYECAGVELEVRSQPTVQILAFRSQTHLLERFPDCDYLLVPQPGNRNCGGERKEQNDLGRVGVNSLRIKTEQARTFIVLGDN